MKNYVGGSQDFRCMAGKANSSKKPGLNPGHWTHGLTAPTGCELTARGYDGRSWAPDPVSHSKCGLTPLAEGYPKLHRSNVGKGLTQSNRILTNVIATTVILNKNHNHLRYFLRSVVAKDMVWKALAVSWPLGVPSRLHSSHCPCNLRFDFLNLLFLIGGVWTR